VGLNWKKIKRFNKYQKTGNEANGNDRGYTHQEIQKVLDFCDQREKTAFLVLASTGMRNGGLNYLKVGDIEKIGDLYKVNAYSDANDPDDRYTTFTSVECAKEIDNYLEYRKRKGEQIDKDSYLIVKRIGKPFIGDSLKSLLKSCISRCGLRQVEKKSHRRKEVPMLHGFRKFAMKQFVESNIKPVVCHMLLGQETGLAGRYYKPTVQDMLTEYMKAINNLTISNEERLKVKVENLQIENSQYESLRNAFEKLNNEVTRLKEQQK
jgi:integrase